MELSNKRITLILPAVILGLICAAAAQAQIGSVGAISQGRSASQSGKSGTNENSIASAAAGQSGIARDAQGHPLPPVDKATSPSRERAYVAAVLADSDAAHSSDPHAQEWASYKADCRSTPKISVDNAFFKSDAVKNKGGIYMTAVGAMVGDLDKACLRSDLQPAMAQKLPKVKDIRIMAPSPGTPADGLDGWTFRFDPTSGILFGSIPPNGAVTLSDNHFLADWVVKNIQ